MSIASSDDVLAAVHDFIDDNIGSSPFLLIGDSYGGYLSRALVRDRPDQVLGLALICPTGTVLRRGDRTLPAMQVLRPDPELIATLDEQTAAEFSAMAVVQTPETARRFREEILAGLKLADGTRDRTNRTSPRRDRSADAGPRAHRFLTVPGCGPPAGARPESRG